MGNLWLKIKVWTKGIIVGALLIYALIFIIKNSGEQVTFWYWFGQQQPTSVLWLVAITFLVGVIGTILVRTTFTTIRQIRDIRHKNRIDRLERETAEMKAKAARLQTRTNMSTSAPAVAEPPPSEH